ncbi:MAG: hypothetical protein A3J38_04410 [Gammaproteobacteria bacterium RIFCSPHIGHO2_12_FULL_45_9]|nr:MAG: hypothetical protein A3J38_04410 [Gammaproteobacteria bacterium RIFCSPHIGHO2_12_FULL_45_9]
MPTPTRGAGGSLLPSPAQTQPSLPLPVLEKVGAEPSAAAVPLQVVPGADPGEEEPPVPAAPGVPQSGLLGVAYLGGTVFSVTPTTTGTSVYSESPNQNLFLWGGGVGYDLALTDQPPGNGYLFRDIAGLIDFLDFNGVPTGSVGTRGGTYQMNMHTWYMMGDFQLDFHPLFKWVIPFAQGGVGFARNAAEMSFEDTDHVFLPNAVTYDLAWDAGGGVKVFFTQNIFISASYLYTSLTTLYSDTTATGTWPSGATAASVSTPLSTNSYLFGISYLL